MSAADGNGFTNKEILLALSKRVDDGFTDLKRMFEAGHGDHEKRLRGLEAKPKPYWTMARISAVATVLAALSGVGYLIAYIAIG